MDAGRPTAGGPRPVLRPPPAGGLHRIVGAYAAELAGERLSGSPRGGRVPAHPDRRPPEWRSRRQTDPSANPLRAAPGRDARICALAAPMAAPLEPRAVASTRNVRRQLVGGARDEPSCGGSPVPPGMGRGVFRDPIFPHTTREGFVSRLCAYSTVTLFARLRGLSIEQPRSRATW